MNLLYWIGHLLRGEPHLIVGDGKWPYMRRWWLIPRNRFVNVYLHQFLRSDDDRALHDHPWASVSVLLKGTLDEVNRELIFGTAHMLCVRRIERHAVVFRKATDRHRIILVSQTAWTLFITGPKVRSWGFWCPRKSGIGTEFVHWEKFTAPSAPGQIGKGCDQ